MEGGEIEDSAEEEEGLSVVIGGRSAKRVGVDLLDVGEGSAVV